VVAFPVRIRIAPTIQDFHSPVRRARRSADFFAPACATQEGLVRPGRCQAPLMRCGKPHRDPLLRAHFRASRRPVPSTAAQPQALAAGHCGPDLFAFLPEGLCLPKSPSTAGNLVFWAACPWWQWMYAIPFSLLPANQPRTSFGPILKADRSGSLIIPCYLERGKWPNITNALFNNALCR
jgi:hypothetical protein